MAFGQIAQKLIASANTGVWELRVIASSFPKTHSAFPPRGPGPPHQPPHQSLIRYPASPGNLTIAAMGMNSAGAQVNRYLALASPGTAGTVVLYSDAQNVVHFECTFGRTYLSALHLTQVTLSRYGADWYWSGNVISTYNQ